MGSSSSKSSSPEQQIISNELLEERRRRALEEYGTLIPPAFGVTGTPSQKGVGPSLSIHHRLLQASVEEPLSYFTYLQETDLSTVLIHDHMQQGLWIAPQVGKNTLARMSAVLANENNSNTNNNGVQGQVFLEHKAGPATVQLRAASSGNTNTSMDPAVSCSAQLSPSCSVFYSSTPNGKHWAGAHFDKTFPLMPTNNDTETKNAAARSSSHYEGLDTMSRTTWNAKMGAWIPLSLPNKKQPLSVQGYAAINLLGATAAVHAELKEGGSNNPMVKTYFSANLNEQHRPPLQLSLSRDSHNHSNSVALTQVLTFDRPQFNVLDDRAPYVRNTAAWTLRMENTTTSRSAEEDSNTTAAPNTATHVSIAGAWQLNRALAVKAVYDSRDTNAFTTALLCKRWEHPRVTCTVMRRWNTSSTNQWRFGMELETGSFASDPSAYYYNHHPHPVTMTISKQAVPYTKAVLPGDEEKNATK